MAGFLSVELVDEMAFRYNNRKNPYLFRDTLMKLVGAETLGYKELISPQP